MQLTINNKTTEEKNEISVSFGKNILMISETSQEWNNEGINNFLIKLASATPDGDQITVEYDEKDENPIYKHIVDLFSTFAHEYNETIVSIII